MPFQTLAVFLMLLITCVMVIRTIRLIFVSAKMTALGLYPEKTWLYKRMNELDTCECLVIKLHRKLVRCRRLQGNVLQANADKANELRRYEELFKEFNERRSKFLFNFHPLDYTFFFWKLFTVQKP